MLMKARQTQKQMKKMTAAGQSKSGATAILVNGLHEIEEVEFDFDQETMDRVGEDFLKKLKKEFMEAYQSARKELESQMSQNMDLDSIRDMLG